MNALEMHMRSLEFLSLAAERVSHGLRTPLSLLNSILVDADMQAERVEDIALLQKAFSESIEVLDLLKLVGAPVSFSLQRVEVSNLLVSHFSEAVEVRVLHAGGPLICRLDSSLLIRAVRGLTCCFAKIAQLPNTSTESKAEIRLEVRKDTHGVSIQVVLDHIDPRQVEHLPQSSTLEEFAHTTHLTEALALLYASLVVELHSGQALFERRSSHQLVALLLFP